MKLFISHRINKVCISRNHPLPGWLGEPETRTAHKLYGAQPPTAATECSKDERVLGCLIPIRNVLIAAFASHFMDRFVSGHDFSRAEKCKKLLGFSPCSLVTACSKMLTGLFLCMCLCPALQAQTQWQIETVDAGNGSKVGKYTSLVIDKQGNLHVGYFDETREALRYAYRAADAKQWFTMEIDGSGGFESLTVDPNGRPHFAYAGPDEQGLRYAWWDGKAWTKQTIDAERINFFTSIRVAPNGLPRISYYHRLNRGEQGDAIYANHLKYASFDGKQWFIETVDARQGTGKYNSLALDDKGLPYISYSDVVTGDLRFVRSDGSEWHYGMPDSAQMSGGWVGIGSSIEVDNTGTPHIAYLDVAHRSLKYASYSEKTGWKTEIVDHLLGRVDNIDRVSLKLDSHQQPHIAYGDSSLGTLKYAALVDKKWKTQVVDHGPNAWQHPSIALTSQDEVYIAYYDGVNGTLRLAHKSGAAASEKTQTAQKPATPAPTN